MIYTLSGPIEDVIATGTTEIPLATARTNTGKLKYNMSDLDYSYSLNYFYYC